MFCPNSKDTWSVSSSALLLEGAIGSSVDWPESVWTSETVASVSESSLRRLPCEVNVMLHSISQEVVFAHWMSSKASHTADKVPVLFGLISIGIFWVTVTVFLKICPDSPIVVELMSKKSEAYV